MSGMRLGFGQIGDGSYNFGLIRHLNRREFLAGAAISAAAPTSAAPAPQIIDTHIHLYDPTRPQGVPWPSKTDPLLYRPMLPEAYAGMVRPLGVTGAIVVEASPWVEDNQWVLELAKAHPVIVGLIGRLEPGTPEFRTNLARFAKNPQFLGIRLNGNAIAAGISQPPFLDDLQRLADAGLMLDAIGNAAMIAALTALKAKVPALRIAIDHMPNEPSGWQDSRAALLDLSKLPHVYCKVSGVLKSFDGKVSGDLRDYRTALDEIWKVFGPDRVMYGSNWPVSDRLAAYGTVLGVVRDYVAGLGGNAAARFFRANSKACYRWTV